MSLESWLDGKLNQTRNKYAESIFPEPTLKESFIASGDIPVGITRKTIIRWLIEDEKMRKMR